MEVSHECEGMYQLEVNAEELALSWERTFGKEPFRGRSAEIRSQNCCRPHIETLIHGMCSENGESNVIVLVSTRKYRPTEITPYLTEIDWHGLEL